VTEVTPKRARKVPLFLKELRDNGGFVGKACEAVAVSKQTVYRWRAEDAEFAADWDRAVDLATEDLEKEVRRRAFHGVDEPVFYKGEVCGQIRKYSDSLLMFAIKARKPEYRDTVKITIVDADRLIDGAIAAHGLLAPETFGEQEPSVS
jgi:hypothetical protein